MGFISRPRSKNLPFYSSAEIAGGDASQGWGFIPTIPGFPGLTSEIIPSFLLAPKGGKGLDKAAAVGEIWNHLSELKFGLADGSGAVPRQGSRSCPVPAAIPDFFGSLSLPNEHQESAGKAGMGGKVLEWGENSPAHPSSSRPIGAASRGLIH